VKDIAEAAATQEQVDKHEERIERIVSKYTVELQEDRKHLRQVSNPHLTETPFRLPQLMLIDVGPYEWLRIGERLPMPLHAESTVSSPGHSVLYYCYGSDMFFLWSAQSG
jgi:hypothetical protein